MYHKCHILISWPLYHLSHIFFLSSHAYLTLPKSIHTISYSSPLCFFHYAESFLQIFLHLNLRRAIPTWNLSHCFCFCFIWTCPVTNLFVSAAILFYYYYSILYLKERGLVSTGTSNTWSECNQSFSISIRILSKMKLNFCHLMSFRRDTTKIFSSSAF